MFTFCDFLHDEKRKQTLEIAHYGLEIIFKGEVSQEVF